MTQKPASPLQKSSSKQLWKQISMNDSSPALRDIKKPSTITDFLKTVHHHENSLAQPSQSDVVSVIYIKNPHFGSLQNYMQEKKYFFGALFSALRSIQSEINCLMQAMQSEMKRDLDKVMMMVSQTVCGYQNEIKQLKGLIEDLRGQNERLKMENQKIKSTFKQRENMKLEQLTETNKQLRNYVKNMNQIMMSYHHKNHQLEESIRYLESKFENILNQSSSASYKSKYGEKSVQRTSITHNLPQSEKDSDQEVAYPQHSQHPQHPQHPQHQPDYIIEKLLGNLNQVNSPKNSSKRFFRRSANPHILPNKLISNDCYSKELSESIKYGKIQSINRCLQSNSVNSKQGSIVHQDLSKPTKSMARK